MTCREKLKIEHPEYINEALVSGCNFCPNYFGYLPDPIDGCSSTSCKECWDREIPEEKTEEDKLDELVIETAEECGIPGYYLNENSTAHVGPFHEDYDKISEFATLDAFIPNTAREAVGLPKITDKFDEIPNEQIVTPEETRHILDSGARREFGTGAVRDIQEGKGRCDLLPMDISAEYLGRFCIADGNLFDNVLHYILLFQNSGKVGHLYLALNYANPFPDAYTMILEVAKQFEEGAKKYGERNWEKGIPVHCYIDSAIRHYLKYKRGDKDEPHDRAVCWNLMCAIWTCKHKPELNEYADEEKES